jgi:hypothetical protein
MSNRMTFVWKALFIVLAFSCLLMTAMAQVGSQAPLPPSPVTSEAPPEHPIPREQLRVLFIRMKTIEAQKIFLQRTLDSQRKTMPSWFPTSVWREVEHDIEAIDIVDVALPVYQKYVSQEAAEAMIFFMDGPTGQQIAELTTQRALAALDTGARGSAADDLAMKAGNVEGDQALWAKRAKELTQAERTRILPDVQALAQVWKKIDDEQDIAFNKKQNAVFQAILKARQADLIAAKRVASQPTQNHAPTP